VVPQCPQARGVSSFIPEIAARFAVAEVDGPHHHKSHHNAVFMSVAAHFPCSSILLGDGCVPWHYEFQGDDVEGYSYFEFTLSHIVELDEEFAEILDSIFIGVTDISAEEACAGETVFVTGFGGCSVFNDVSLAFLAAKQSPAEFDTAYLKEGCQVGVLVQGGSCFLIVDEVVVSVLPDCADQLGPLLYPCIILRGHVREISMRQQWSSAKVPLRAWKEIVELRSREFQSPPQQRSQIGVALHTALGVIGVDDAILPDAVRLVEKRSTSSRASKTKSLRKVWNQRQSTRHHLRSNGKTLDKVEDSSESGDSCDWQRLDGNSAVHSPIGAAISGSGDALVAYLGQELSRSNHEQVDLPTGRSRSEMTTARAVQVLPRSDYRAGGVASVQSAPRTPGRTQSSSDARAAQCCGGTFSWWPAW